MKPRPSACYFGVGAGIRDQVGSSAGRVDPLPASLIRLSNQPGLVAKLRQNLALAASNCAYDSRKIQDAGRGRLHSRIYCL
jgi:hypothetical protein